MGLPRRVVLPYSNFDEARGRTTRSPIRPEAAPPAVQGGGGHAHQLGVLRDAQVALRLLVEDRRIPGGQLRPLRGTFSDEVRHAAEPRSTRAEGEGAARMGVGRLPTSRSNSSTPFPVRPPYLEAAS